jgi:4-diphosphocytidyl-2-C-methyl-D-erythritol kinase
MQRVFSERGRRRDKGIGADSACLKVMAPAKLNLTFEIGEVRADGFHDISSLFHAIDLCDSITFVAQQSDNFAVTVNAQEEHPTDFPSDDSNLICKAGHAFASRFSEKLPFELSIGVQKNIPIGAGMGGGSSDAAATLFVLNGLCGEPFSIGQLIEIAATIGADVPFCVLGGTALGEGKGEVLAPIPVTAPLHFVIAKPVGISISTAWAYSTYDQRLNKTISQERGRHAAQLLKDNNPWQSVLGLLGNDFEEMIFEHYPVLAQAKNILLGNGASACHLTGKGPTLYAITDGAEAADKLALNLENNLGNVKFDCWKAKSLNHGVKSLD